MFLKNIPMYRSATFFTSTFIVAGLIPAHDAK
jgi:hypothetical protein